jgi:hypothetical protein
LILKLLITIPPDVKECNTLQNENQSNDENENITDKKLNNENFGNDRNNGMKVIDSKSTQPPLTDRAKLIQNRNIASTCLKKFSKSKLFNICIKKQNKHLFNLTAK